VEEKAKRRYIMRCSCVRQRDELKKRDRIGLVCPKCIEQIKHVEIDCSDCPTVITTNSVNASKIVRCPKCAKKHTAERYRLNNIEENKEQLRIKAEACARYDAIMPEEYRGKGLMPYECVRCHGTHYRAIIRPQTIRCKPCQKAHNKEFRVRASDKHYKANKAQILAAQKSPRPRRSIWPLETRKLDCRRYRPCLDDVVRGNRKDCATCGLYEPQTVDTMRYVSSLNPGVAPWVPGPKIV